MDINTDIHLIGASRSQQLQLSYYKTAVANYNKKQSDDSKKLSILITPFALKALLFAFKDLMDLPKTIEAFNNYQIEKQKEVFTNISQDSKDTLNRLLVEIKEKDNTDIQIIKIEDGHSTCTVSEIYGKKENEKRYMLTEPLIESDVKDINLEYNDNMKFESEKELILFINEGDPKLEFDSTSSIGDFERYSTGLMISGRDNNVLHVEDAYSSSVVQDTIEKASNLALSYLFVNRNFIGKNAYEEKLAGADLLGQFVKDENIKCDKYLGRDEFVITLADYFSFSTKDVTDFGIEDLYDKVLISLGLICNETLDTYYKVVNYKKTLGELHHEVYFSNGSRFLFAGIDHGGTMVEGLTIHHCLTRLFERCDDSWFVKVSDVSKYKRLVHISSDVFVSGYVRFVEDYCIWPFGLKNRFSNVTLTYEGIEFIKFINEMYSLRRSYPYEKWKEFVIEQFRRRHKEFGDLDVDFYINRSGRRRFKYLL
jgi:hypothetical protein